MYYLRNEISHTKQNGDFTRIIMYVLISLQSKFDYTDSNLVGPLTLTELLRLDAYIFKYKVGIYI